MIPCYMMDVHVANRCNLNCDGCNHWSNYGFKEIFSAKTLYNWADNNDDFLHILAELNTEQEFTLLNNGLTGEFNTAITKLVLTKHDYSDKVAQDVTSSDGSMKPVVVELVGVTNESSGQEE